MKSGGNVTLGAASRPLRTDSIDTNTPHRRSLGRTPGKIENCTTVYFVNNDVAGVSCCLGTLFLVAGILVVVSFRGFVQSLIMAEIPLLPDSQVPR